MPAQQLNHHHCSHQTYNKFNGICDLIDSLENFPYKFPKEDLFNNDNIRYATIWSYKIVYAVENKTILILRVFNTKMNPKKLKK